MRAPRFLAFGSLVLLAAAALRCGGSSSSDGSGGGTGKGGTAAGGNATGGSAANHAGAAGTHASSGGDGGAAASANGDAGAAPDADAGLTTPVIGDIADVSVVQNTLTATSAQISFTVSDDGGLTGLTVSAKSANASVVPAKGTCRAGMCMFDIAVTPLAPGSVALTVTVSNPRGGSATSTFAVVIAPLMVTVQADAGAGSLRGAIQNSMPGDVVAFGAAVKKITLATELDITRPITLQGPGATALTIDGGKLAQTIGLYADANISGVTITHGTFCIDMLEGHLTLSDSVLTGAAGPGLAMGTSMAGSNVVVDATNTTFSNNAAGGAVLEPYGAGSTVTANFKGCTFTGNDFGVGGGVTTAGQIATLNLLGGNQVHDNVRRGIVLEIDNSAGSILLAMPPAGGTGDNVVTKNPVGVYRSGPVPSTAITIAPTTQVTANTANFTPAWP